MVHSLRGCHPSRHSEGVHGERSLWLRLLTSPQTRKQERRLQEELYPMGFKDPCSGCVFPSPGLSLSGNAPRDAAQGVAHEGLWGTLHLIKPTIETYPPGSSQMKRTVKRRQFFISCSKKGPGNDARRTSAPSRHSWPNTCCDTQVHNPTPS